MLLRGRLRSVLILQPSTAFSEALSEKLYNFSVDAMSAIRDGQLDMRNPSYSANIKKKEISWKDSEYLDNVRLEGISAKATRCQSIFRDLNAKSQAAILERKPSIGPCFKPRMLYGGPSGITVCVPKKSIRTMKEEFNPIQSVIDFNVSKKAVTKSTPHIISTKQVPKKTPMKLEKEALKIDDDQQHIKFLGVLRTKLDNMSGRIRNLLNM